MRADPVAEALERERTDRFRLDVVADKPVGLIREEDLSRIGHLLETSREVDRGAGDQRRPRIGPRHDTTGSHADPDVQRDAPFPLEVAAQEREFALHVGRGAHRSQGVVLVNLGHTEHGHHRVADELLDAATMTLHCPPHRFEVAREDPVEGLGVESTGERRRADEIAEHDRHVSPRPDSLRFEGGSARGAESRVIGIRLAAASADRHRSSVGSPGWARYRPSQDTASERLPEATRSSIRRRPPGHRSC